MNKSEVVILCIAHTINNNFKLLLEVMTSDFDVYVHFDKKSEIKFANEILEIKKQYRDKVFFVENNIEVYWGGFSQVLAEYNLLKYAYYNNSNYSHFLLISGADFPIKSNNYINKFFSNNEKVSFIQCNKLPADGWGMNGGLDRFQRFWLTDFKNRQNTRVIGRITLSIQKIIGIKKKDYFKVYYGGANWANLSRHAVKYIVELVNNDEQVLNSFKWSRACVEIWKQTILKTSDKNTIVNDCLRYVDWSGRYPPKVLDISDFDKLMKSNALFARKMHDDDLTLQNKLLESFQK